MNSLHSETSYKRLSAGRFRWWPRSQEEATGATLQAHELQLLIYGGDPTGVEAAPAESTAAIAAAS